MYVIPGQKLFPRCSCEVNSSLQGIDKGTNNSVYELSDENSCTSTETYLPDRGNKKTMSKVISATILFG